jgi:hypothetical protein
VRGDTRIPDVPFDAAGVSTISPAVELRKLPTVAIPIRLIAVSDAGERMIAEYTMSHTAYAG